MIETPVLELFKTSLRQNKQFNKNRLRNSDYFDIENNGDFNMCSLNIFSKASYQGFVKLWVNGIFYNWEVYYFILVENSLLKI